ncbi:MAG: hypothetical protein LBQ46_10920 [Treponema sp.]|jgi:hypothetical protein|nr:hypothetical protein [Treponema sp.]
MRFFNTNGHFRSFGLGCLGALLLAALLPACTQDPIFAMIAREVKPREPQIKGVPTKMVVFEYGSQKAVFVGASSLHRYIQVNGQAVWDSAIPQPPGKIIDLAATENYLYALTNADSPALYRLGKQAPIWEQVSFPHADFPRLQAIYGAVDDKGMPLSDYIFVGSLANSLGKDDRTDYAVYRAKDSGGAALSFTALKEGTSLLSGAAYDGNNYYFSTKGDGVYWLGGSSPVMVTGKENVRGMIRVDSSILALCYGGDILKIDGTGSTVLNSTGTGHYLRGPAAVYRTANGQRTRLLTAVIARDSYSNTYGYREIDITTGPILSSVPGEIILLEPGTPPYGTMDDVNRYRDTIEPKPVNAIFQVPSDIDPEMTLFASIQGTGTMKNDTDGGLWSYRAREGGWQWNAE